MNEVSPQSDCLQTSVLQKIKESEDLIKRIDSLRTLDGVGKLQRKVMKELCFLKRISKSGNMKKEHLQCSNLTHFTALVDTIVQAENCISVNKVFMLHEKKIAVDIIADNGLTWIKVVARNPKSLSQISLGDSSYGVRSIIDQAEEYLECVKLYPCLFQIPKILFVFANGVGAKLAAKIESLGIMVQGSRLTDIEELDLVEDASSEDIEMYEHDHSLSTPNVAHIRRVNLDVSAMLAYVSSVTNGSASLYNFSVNVLAQQAEWEKQRPQKPILDSFFEGKTLYCCQTAKDNFENIVNTVGGPSEKIRAKKFLDRIIVLPDDATVNDIDEELSHCTDLTNFQFSKNKTLPLGGKVKKRSLTIFTFGDRIGAVTVTANDGFVRSAKQQGIHFVVFIHESRALTEQKECTKGTVIN